MAGAQNELLVHRPHLPVGQIVLPARMNFPRPPPLLFQVGQILGRLFAPQLAGGREGPAQLGADDGDRPPAGDAVHHRLHPLDRRPHPLGADHRQRQLAVHPIQRIQPHILPDSMQVELINAMAQGNADGFKIMMDWCEATQSKAILGGSLTSQTGANGNRSLGDVHNEVRLDIRNDDASKIDRALSDYLIYPIAVLNGLTDPGRAPRFVSDTQEPDDLALYADALPKLVAIGMTIPARYAHEKLKIPEPDGDEPVLSAGGSGLQPATEPGNPSALAALAAGRGLKPVLSGVEGAAPTPDIDPTPVGAHTEQLAREAAPPLDALIDRVRGLVDSADSLDALRDDLLAAYGDLDTRELTNVMALAFACADLAGRHDAREE